MPKFAVCLLTHNNGRYIREAVESVSAQTMHDWECLISDDASVDGTGDLVRPYLSDSRVRYTYHRENLRQAGNWSYAIQHTSAPMVATLHADDVWKADALQTYDRAFAIGREIGMVSANWLRVNPQRVPLAHQHPNQTKRLLSGEDAARMLLRENCILPSACAVRREILLATGSPRSDFGMLCDRQYALRIALHSQVVSFLSEVITDYRVHPESVSTQYFHNGRLLCELDAFDEELPQLLAGFPDVDAQIRVFRKEIADFYFRSAIGDFAEGRQREAAHRLSQALSFNPRLLRNPKSLGKWLLAHGGTVGQRLLRRFHGRNRWVSAATKSSASESSPP